jgi:NADPH2:quinone reductase
VGGAGGTGSIAIQLLKKVANMTVVATASKEETTSYCKELGADYVINHRKELKP